jgi:signal transduction histidine kinase
VLDRLGLVEGLEWLLNQFKLRSAIHTILQVEGVRERVAPDISIALFRITQEALTNIVRHSHATEVKVFLMETDESLILAIEDNGDGFNPGECLSAPSLGLLGMRERAARLHGELDIVSAVGKGTELVVSIPKKHNREGNEPS